MTSTSPRIKKPARTLLWVLLDVLLVNASLFLAQVVRYSSNISYSFFENSIRLAPAMTVIFLLVFCGFGMYRTMWQYASANDVLRIALATLVASLITYLFSLAANAFVRPQNLFRLHRMVYLLFWIISMAMVGASRLLYRIVVTRERFALLSTPPRSAPLCWTTSTPRRTTRSSSTCPPQWRTACPTSLPTCWSTS